MPSVSTAYRFCAFVWFRLLLGLLPPRVPNVLACRHGALPTPPPSGRCAHRQPALFAFAAPLPLTLPRRHTFRPGFCAAIILFVSAGKGATRASLTIPLWRTVLPFLRRCVACAFHCCRDNLLFAVSCGWFFWRVSTPPVFIPADHSVQIQHTSPIWACATRTALPPLTFLIVP